MRNILVTAISGNVSNGVLKCLVNGEDRLFGCDVYDYPVGMDKVLKCWKSKFAVDKEYIDDLLLKCRENEITHLIPVNEIEIEVISKHLDKFEAENIKVLINRKDIIEIFLDKEATINRLGKISGVDVPKIYDEFTEEMKGKKYIIKPKKSCGSKHIKIIESKEEWDEIETKDDYIIQEYIDASDEEYTVGVFSNGTKTSTIVFKRKLENGYTSFVELVHDERIKEFSEKIAKEINLQGYINIQLRKKDGKYYIFEINPRISGTVFFREMLGFSDVKWWLNLIDGNIDYEYKIKCKKAIGVRELAEKYVVME